MKQTIINNPKVIYRTDQPKKDGSNTFYLQLHFNGVKISLSMYVSCKLQDFDARNIRVKTSNPFSEQLNNEIDRLYLKAFNLIFEARANKEPVSIKWFKDRFYDKPVDHKGNDFYAFIESEMSIQVKGTKKKQTTFKKDRDQFNKLKTFAPKLEFSDVTETFLADYEEWNLKTRGNGKSGSNNSLKLIRKFINIAIEKGHTQNNPFKNYKITEPKNDTIKHLEIEELHKISEYYASLNPTHKHFRTLKSFLFGCHTSFRFGDCEKFKLAHIINDCIFVQQEKTNKTVSVRLLQDTKALLNYDLDINLPNLNTPCNQTCNRALKEVAKICKINKKITFHFSRHTFGTTAVNNGVPHEVVQAVMGHSSSKQTDHYAKLNNKTKIMEMAKLENVFSFSKVSATIPQQQ